MWQPSVGNLTHYVSFVTVQPLFQLNFMRKNNPPKNFENALAELEETVSQMESGQLPLDQSLAAFERGTELLRFCRQALAETEQKVQLLDDSNTLQPYPDAHE
jgi:exodeoxyribonuclease VII small subunit